MSIRRRNLSILSVTVLAIAGCVLGAAVIRAQPAGGDDPLPPGFSRDANTGALLVTAPPAVQFQPEENKDRLAELTSNLSVGSFSLDEAGYVKAFTVNSLLGDFPDGTEITCRSVTLNADGTLDSLVLAENAADSGCDMKVVIDGGVTTYTCDKTTCTTVCDTQTVKDPVTGKVTITCNCRATP